MNKSFTSYYVKKESACEQWLEIWSSFCRKMRMALDKECEPKYNMVMRSFWRSNCGVSEDLFSSQPLFQLN